MLFTDRAAVAQLAHEAEIDESQIARLLDHLDALPGRPVDAVRRVEVGENQVAVVVDLAHGLEADPALVRHVLAAKIRLRGVERRIVLSDADSALGATGIDPALVKAIVRARRWFDQLADGGAQSLVEIATAEGVSDRYVGKLLPLAFLAPDLVAGALAGTQTFGITAEILTKRVTIPMSWSAQRELLTSPGSR